VLIKDRYFYFFWDKKMDITCKSCGSTKCVKNGKVREAQRFKCKECGLAFVLGDKRQKVSPQAKALAVLLYGSGKSGYGFIAKLFNVSRATVLKWIKKVAGQLPGPSPGDDIKEVQLDEMWHFLNEKNKSCGYGGPWIVLQTKPLDGLSAIVLLKQSSSFIKQN